MPASSEVRHDLPRRSVGLKIVRFKVSGHMMYAGVFAGGGGGGWRRREGGSICNENIFTLKESPFPLNIFKTNGQSLIKHYIKCNFIG